MNGLQRAVHQTFAANMWFFFCFKLYLIIRNLPHRLRATPLIQGVLQKLVTKIMDKNSYIFSATHPDHLSQIVEMQKRKQDHEFHRTIEELKKISPEPKKILKKPYVSLALFFACTFLKRNGGSLFDSRRCSIPLWQTKVFRLIRC